MRARLHFCMGAWSQYLCMQSTTNVIPSLISIFFVMIHCFQDHECILLSIHQYTGAGCHVQPSIKHLKCYPELSSVL